MSLKLLGHIELPRNFKQGGFDRATVTSRLELWTVPRTANNLRQT